MHFLILEKCDKYFEECMKYQIIYKDLILGTTISRTTRPSSLQKQIINYKIVYKPVEFKTPCISFPKNN